MEQHYLVEFARQFELYTLPVENEKQSDELEEILLSELETPDEIRRLLLQYILGEEIEAKPPIEVTTHEPEELIEKLREETIERIKEGLDIYVYKYTLNDKRFGFIYYELPKKKPEAATYFYASDMDGVTIRRVPQSVLGPNVLGRAFVFAKYIEILDTLHGADYEEVKTHEILHVKYPFEPEEKIRERTRALVPYARFN